MFPSITRAVGLVGTIIALPLTLALSVPSSAANLPNYLPNCRGIPERKPSVVVFACADFNLRATDLRWTQWGEYYAYARGKLQMNDCAPDCAEGHFQSYSVSVTAFGRQQCPNGEIAYTTVRYTYQRPYSVAPYTIAGHTYTTRYGPPQTADSTFPCTPRP